MFFVVLASAVSILPLPLGYIGWKNRGIQKGITGKKLKWSVLATLRVIIPGLMLNGADIDENKALALKKHEEETLFSGE